MRKLSNAANVDMSNPVAYPNGRIKDNTGAGDGTPVNEFVYGDFHQFKDKAMRESGTNYNDLPDNETNGNQFYEAVYGLPTKNDLIKPATKTNATTISVPIKLGVIKPDESVNFIANDNFVGTETILRGSDFQTMPLEIYGEIKQEDEVQIINRSGTAEMRVVYTSRLIPNLFTRLASLEASLATLNEKTAVFQAGGGMVLWNKPAIDIPTGWAEVVDWRGRIPAGVDTLQSEFSALGFNGGSKTVSVPANVPIQNYGYIGSQPPSAATGGGKLLVSSGNNETGEFLESIVVATFAPTPSQTVNILNPYRTVMFIEYIN